jgi:hypothetical protein
VIVIEVEEQINAAELRAGGRYQLEGNAGGRDSSSSTSRRATTSTGRSSGRAPSGSGGNSPYSDSRATSLRGMRWIPRRPGRGRRPRRGGGSCRSAAGAGDAAIEAGGDPAGARAAAERTTRFYAGA